MLKLVWERLLEEDERETSEILDVDPALVDPLLSTMHIVCVLDPAVMADTDVRRLHVALFGKDHSQRHLKTLMGAALRNARPMQAAVQGSKV